VCIHDDDTYNAAKSSWRGPQNNFMTTGSHNVRSRPPAFTERVKVCWPECGSTGSTLMDTFKVKIIANGNHDQDLRNDDLKMD
jgi:hypothetical protein